jgi:hypothetical protein
MLAVATTAEGYLMSTAGLRRGDLVEVRGPAEILATLDERGALDHLPFMPEMAAFCGQRFVVDRRTEKICDTIKYSGSRRVHDTVLLGDLRCDGKSHEGCQAECRLFWKEVWLRKVTAESPAAAPPLASDVKALIERTSRHMKYTVEVEGKAEERWWCQNTELPKASEHLALWDPRNYLKEYTCGNVSFGTFLKVTSRAVVKEPQRKLGLIPEVHLKGSRLKPVTDPPLDLQPGELVQVKSIEEIALTLSPEGRNKGLWFDREMMPYCGGTYRVRQRVTKIIDEYRDGRMVVMKTPSVTLDGVTCSGELSLRRWFCPRSIVLYWREAWLRRVEPARSEPKPSA